MTTFSPSELILTKEGRVYHLDLFPNEVADRVVLVGDPDRVELISAKFDSIEYTRRNREFVCHTGMYEGKAVSALSTGIGTDNIDIVVNELDILARVDLQNRTLLEEGRTFRLIRMGTCGILHESIPVGAFIKTNYSVGFDSLMHFYKTSDSYEVHQLKVAMDDHLKTSGIDLPFYMAEEKGEFNFNLPDRHMGITVTLPGFYGPQGRKIRADVRYTEFLKTLNEFREDELRVVNFEMESSGLFGLAGLLGHECSCICLGLANRITGEHLSDPAERQDLLIREVLNAI